MRTIQSSFNSQNFEIIQSSMRGTQVLNMLNMKYLIYNSEGQPIMNSNANGFAWSIKDIVYVKSPNEEIQKLAKIS